MEEKIITLLHENVEELEGVTITSDMELISGGFMDSFSVIGLISNLEEAFDITIDLDQIDLEEFNTVPSIIAIIHKFSK